MSQQVPSSGILLNERQEKLVQAFRDHKSTFSHRPKSQRYLPTGKFHGAGQETFQSLIELGLLESDKIKGWRLTDLGWEIADYKID
jgi:hypothetical protein